MSDLTAPNRNPWPRTSWGWFVGLGILQLVLGFIAWFDVVAFTIAGTIFIGALLLVAGIFQIIHSFMDRSWGSFALHLIAGVLYVIGGFLIMDEPLDGAVVITIFVSVVLVVGGILRIIMAIRHRPESGWGWLLIGGLISFVVGIMLYTSLPWSGLWVVGTLIAVELIVQGVSWLQFGLALRRNA